MKRLFSVICFLICLSLLPSVSLAENVNSPLSMDELSIKILPEFAFHPADKNRTHPPLLVGYQGTLINKLDHSVKGRIQIPLPIHEKNFRIGYVADYSSDLKKAYQIQYTLDKRKGVITWTTTEPIESQGRYKFIIEFYTDSLIVNKDKRSLFYKFKSFADIGLVDISITQPSQSKNVKLNPSPAENGHNDNTFTYYFQKVKAGEEKKFTLTYNRSETKTTMQLLNAKKPNKEKESNTRSAKKPNYLVTGSIGGAGLLLTSTFILFIKNRKRKF